MQKIYYQQDCNLAKLNGKTVAIIGYGSQGHAHALNLKDSGVNVIVGLYQGSKSWAKAEQQGLTVMTAAGGRTGCCYETRMDTDGAPRQSAMTTSTSVRAVPRSRATTPVRHSSMMPRGRITLMKALTLEGSPVTSTQSVSGL